MTTNNQLSQFMQTIQKNSSIQQKLKQAANAKSLAIAEIAKEAGFIIPIEELMSRGYWWE
jgi:predicted ribosomally synthesized peptide with nif11-like leader